MQDSKWDEDSYEEYSSMNLVTYMAKRFKLSTMEKIVLSGFIIGVVAVMIWFGLMCFKYGHALEGIIIIVAFLIIVALVFLFKLFTSNSLETIAKMQYGKQLRIIEGDMFFDQKESPMQCILYEYAIELKTFDEEKQEFVGVLDDLIEYTAITHLFVNKSQTSLAVVFMDTKLKKHTLSFCSEKPLKNYGYNKSDTFAL